MPVAIRNPTSTSSSEWKSDSSPAITGSTLPGIAAMLAMTMAATAKIGMDCQASGWDSRHADGAGFD